MEELEPLTEDNIADEVELLYEDMLNWECGHAMPAASVEADE